MDADFMQSFEFVQLQMQLVIMTATQIRKNLEEGNQEQVWQAMEHTESAGVAQQILKQSIVHACGEAANLQQELNGVLNKLESFGATQNSKSKAVLAGLASGQDKALVATTFGAWMGWLLKMKSEKDIRDMFEEQIAAADRKLFEYKERQLANVKGVINRGNAASVEDLLKSVFEGWNAGIMEQKREKAAA